MATPRPVLIISRRPAPPLGWAMTLVGAWVLLGHPATSPAADLPKPVRAMIDAHCFACHDADTRDGGLDLTALAFDPADAKSAAKWVQVYDRVRDGEMPPKKKARPDAASVDAFLKAVADPLVAADQDRGAREGRAGMRRLNRFEYENTLRDLLHAPWLDVKDLLPEDGEAHRFNKVGDALTVSHVQMSAYLAAADKALHQVLATSQWRPTTARYYAREQKSFINRMVFRPVFNTSPERAMFPMLGVKAQPELLDGKLPTSVGAADPAVREQEAFGTVASTYVGNEYQFDGFVAKHAGTYRLRFSAYTFWAGPGKGKKWWVPDRADTSKGRRSEPVSIYSRTKGGVQRLLGSFDATPEPGVYEIVADLQAGETIRPDAARLFRSRPPNWQNPLATPEGMPGVAYRRMEVEGPVVTKGLHPGLELLVDDLPVKATADGGVEVVADDPKADAERLVRRFIGRAYRRPVTEPETARVVAVVRATLDAGAPFTEALLAGYSTVLCSPGVLFLEERPGPLDDFALSSRLSYFLWNSPPDDELRKLAKSGELRKPDVLQAQADRLLHDPKASRFGDAFLDYWLDLRKIDATTPDAALYADYYLDDLLTESAVAETRLFFAELLRHDLPARNVVASDFAMLNERLAAHYGLPLVDGVPLRRVALPKDSVRGGLLTQASVLKVTANGTTTSPVLRGVWVMERIVGKTTPPPPPGTPAVEPDIRGAVTIRQQLDKHRAVASCAACHVKIDPAGFALESFDVLGAWRGDYRALGEGGKPRPGFGHNGQPLQFHDGPAVDCGGQLPDGRAFADVRELKRLLAADERQIARNLVRQLVVYGTGAPVRFGDRAAVEAILDRAADKSYGVQSLVLEIVQSPLFRNK